jgi:hypothetical protein
MKKLIEEREDFFWLGEASDECMGQYYDYENKKFKGEDRFASCVEAMTKCNKKAHSPEGLCNKIARGKK